MSFGKSTPGESYNIRGALEKAQSKLLGSLSDAAYTIKNPAPDTDGYYPDKTTLQEYVDRSYRFVCVVNRALSDQAYDPYIRQQEARAELLSAAYLLDDKP